MNKSTLQEVNDWAVLDFDEFKPLITKSDIFIFGIIFSIILKKNYNFILYFFNLYIAHCIYFNFMK